MVGNGVEVSVGTTFASRLPGKTDRKNEMMALSSFKRGQYTIVVVY